MLTEQFRQFELDGYTEPEAVIDQIQGLEKDVVPVVNLVASLDAWDAIDSVLCSLRSSNISVILTVKREGEKLDDEELQYVFSSLHKWDQMLLCNFLSLCGERVPEPYRDTLQTEARIELKWFSEWLVASSDTRIHRYPGLPWRSFIRKIGRENYRFATDFLKGTQRGALETDPEVLSGMMRLFLAEKKKVVCIFPKRWGRA